METEKLPVADDQHQSQIAASLRLSEAKLAGILASAEDLSSEAVHGRETFEDCGRSFE
jgi:DNA-binding transcriptional regulator LsrR (DeoR family)